MFDFYSNSFCIISHGILREQRLERVQIVAVDDHIAVIVMAFGREGSLGMSL